MSLLSHRHLTNEEWISFFQKAWNGTKYKSCFWALQACLKFHRPITILFVFSRGKKKRNNALVRLQRCLSPLKFRVPAIFPLLLNSPSFHVSLQLEEEKGERLTVSEFFYAAGRGKLTLKKNMGGSNKRTLFNWPLDKTFEASPQSSFCFCQGELYIDIVASRKLCSE